MLLSCMIIFQAFISFVTALFGAGFGAFAAYWFAKRQAEEKIYRDNHASAVGALYILIFRVSTLENFCRGFLNKDRADLDADQKFKLIGMHFPSESIDLKSLMFLVDSEHSQLVYDIKLTEGNFFNFVDSIRERNASLENLIHASEFTGVSEKTGFTIRELNDPDLLKVVNDQTAFLPKGSVNNLAATEKVITRIVTMIKRKFPDLPCPCPEIIPKAEQNAAGQSATAE